MANDPEFHEDKFGRTWEIWGDRTGEFCPVCGQPDNCGDCNHEKLSVSRALYLGGYITHEEVQELENG